MRRHSTSCRTMPRRRSDAFKRRPAHRTSAGVSLGPSYAGRFGCRCRVGLAGRAPLGWCVCPCHVFSLYRVNCPVCAPVGVCWSSVSPIAPPWPSCEPWRGYLSGSLFGSVFGLSVLLVRVTVTRLLGSKSRCRPTSGHLSVSPCHLNVSSERVAIRVG